VTVAGGKLSHVNTRPADTTPGHDIAHVVVAGGTVGDWESFGPADWGRRIDALRRGVAGSGTRWVSLFPVRADPADGDPHVARGVLRDRLLACDGTAEVAGQQGRFVHRDDASPVTVVIDTRHDGRDRFASVVERMRRDGEAAGANEADLTRSLMDPCPHEPDLVVVLGPPDELPTSLVWELAYSELVFLTLGWDALESAHLEMAVEDFRRRHRRFGGLDS
jgi:undecaprenyl diphosphate synthase